ncbi:hypothetical protein ALNOE001_22230 [Candidatus Methanobinarius endosymbioticus]|uniref:HTH lysR-type domain-containing protein n=1 Tax=Candidatus Methanobinarius endosymbioticus TaxID=2006182 RepID=A0A366MA76_9EURY|nr:hypothetical protein ALNOE001_22230 [Candidatus Methanobinarius endosymbioticus]
MNNKIKPKIEIEINGEIYNYKLFESLKLLDSMNSQRAVAKKLGIAHSVLNRRIKNAENKLNFDLVKVIGSKTYLTKECENLVEIYQKYNLRVKESDKIIIAGGHIVTNFLDSISEEIPFEIEVYGSNDNRAYELAKKGLIDILALDDPKLAFTNYFDFTAIGYDHLVIVSNDSNSCMDLKDIKELNGLNFISVDGTAQRLAWNTMNEKNIDYNIEKEVKSEIGAFKIVKNSENTYTFLNASYFKGNELLKEETKHVISLIPINNEKKEVNDLIEYISNEGQKLISREGFLPVKPWKTKN